jgi:hypothetical protein
MKKQIQSDRMVLSLIEDQSSDMLQYRSELTERYRRIFGSVIDCELQELAERKAYRTKNEALRDFNRVWDLCIWHTVAEYQLRASVRAGYERKLLNRTLEECLKQVQTPEMRKNFARQWVNFTEQQKEKSLLVHHSNIGVEVEQAVVGS